MTYITNLATNMDSLIAQYSKIGRFGKFMCIEDHEQLRIKPMSITDRIASFLIHPPQNSSKDYFIKVFGKRRIERIFKQLHIGAYFSRQQFAEFFLRLGETLASDYDELLDDIRSPKPIRFLNELESKEVRSLFQTAEKLEECTVAQLKKLSDVLLPFSNYTHIFLNSLPDIKDITMDSGNDFPSLQRRVFVYEYLRRRVLCDSPMTAENWQLIIVKMLSQREPVAGVAFPTYSGRLSTVQWRVSGGGAMKYFLRTLGRDSSSEGDTVLYRGTSIFPRSTDWWKSISDDLRTEMGESGTKVTQAETQDILTNPIRGFCRTASSPLTALGFSLGGIHAANDVLLFPTKFTHLVTVASPGLRTTLTQQFSASVHTHIRKIDHYFECPGDVVDQFGDKHLGAGCARDTIDIKIHLLDLSSQEVPTDIGSEVKRIGALRKKLTNVHFLPQIPKAIINLSDAFITTHNRPTVFYPHYRNIVISNQESDELVQQILNHSSPLTDTQWEKLRLDVAKVLGI